MQSLVGFHSVPDLLFLIISGFCCLLKLFQGKGSKHMDLFTVYMDSLDLFEPS